MFVFVAYALSAQAADFAVIAALLSGFTVSLAWKVVAYIKLSPVEYIFLKNRK
ncbi:hypothetical protein D3C80_1694850 [compost metagenome]